VPKCYKQGQSSSARAGCDKRTRAREAEESSLLEVVARERLVKTLHAENDLVFAAMICKVWRSAMAL
jgi:hypothetical protein